MSGQRATEGEARAEAGADELRLGDQAPLKLEHFLPYQLNLVSSLVSQALSRVYARRYGIGVPEWRVVVTLGQHGVMTAKAIGAHTHMHKTKVSRAVALLEKRRLVARRANRDDMREAFLSLTTAGRAMYEEVAPHALEFARRLTDILSPGDREAFDRAIATRADAPRTFYLRGQCEMQLRDFPAAVRDFEESIRGDAKLPLAMGGYPDQQLRPEHSADLGRRKILLADVDPVEPSRPHQRHTIIQD